MKNSLKALALSLLAVATLAGCFKVSVDLTLNENDTINGSMVVAIQKGVGDSLGMSDEDMLAELSNEIGEDRQVDVDYQFPAVEWMGAILAQRFVGVGNACAIHVDMDRAESGDHFGNAGFGGRIDEIIGSSGHCLHRCQAQHHGKTNASDEETLHASLL